ncbi:hypothetical protein D3C73_1230160 [compost metagenome]
MYVSAYFVAIAKNPDTKSQNILPIPPITIATAIPTTVPVPIVPANIVIKDLYELIPSSVFFLSPIKMYNKPLKVYFCGIFNFRVKNI